MNAHPVPEKAPARVKSLCVQRLHERAHLPRRADDGAAGYDLYACGAQNSRIIRTGVAVEIPADWVGVIKDRSGIAVSGRAFTVAGVIDSSYRGEVKIVFDREIDVEDGERIAQLVIVPHYSGAVREVSDLSHSARGEGGFGSTGKF